VDARPADGTAHTVADCLMLLLCAAASALADSRESCLSANPLTAIAANNMNSHLPVDGALCAV
jgi:hypothetical protein